MSETPQHDITQEDFQSMVQQWMDYTRSHLAEVHIKKKQEEWEPIKERMIQEGYASEKSGEGEKIIESLSRYQAVQEQKKLLDLNVKRVHTLAGLTDRKPKELKGTTVVSIGGGPGDKIAEPWFPRIAAITGANVINFDYSPEHPIDKELNLYTHIGGSRGDIFQLLSNEKRIYQELGGRYNIQIIECNNLIGNNVSPELGLTLGELSDLPKHPKVVEMRKNLIKAAEDLLADGGVLAIDKAYWVKKDGKLNPVDENGKKRDYTIFPDEALDS